MNKTFDPEKKLYTLSLLVQDIPGVLRFLVCGKEGQLFGNDFLLVPFGKLFVVHIVFLQGQRMTICSATACAAA